MVLLAVAVALRKVRLKCSRSHERLSIQFLSGSCSTQGLGLEEA